MRFQKFQFYLRKRVNRDIFGQELRMKNVLLIYFEQIVSFCAIIYSNTNSLQLFCANWQISQVGYFFALILENFTQVQEYLTYSNCSLVPLVTNSMSDGNI